MTDPTDFQHLTELSRFVVSINTCDDENAIYRTLAEYLPQLVLAERTSICLLDDTPDSLSIFTLAGEQGLVCTGKRMRIDRTFTGQAIMEGKSKRFSRNQKSVTEDYEELVKLGYKAFSTAPIYKQGKAVGTLNIATSRVEEYDKNTQKTLEAVASMTSTCLDRQAMLDQTRDAAGQFFINLERLNILAETTPKLSTTTDLNEAFYIISEAFCSLLPMNLVSYVAYDAENQLFTTMETCSQHGEYQFLHNIESAGSAMELVLHKKSPVFYEEVSNSPYSDLQLLATAGLACAWFAPVYSKTEIVGVLIVAAKNVPKYHADMLNRVSIMGNMLGSARDRILSHQQLEKLAYTDSLTGLPNRARYNVEIDKLLNSNDKTPFTLCLIDFNNFKELNDQYGHPTGDKFLQVAGKWLRDEIHPSDFVARLGGDEFAILSKPIAGSNNLNTQLQNTLKKERVEMQFGRRSIILNFCVGIVQYPLHANEKNELFRDADLALYSAKSDPSEQIKFYTTSLLEEFHKRVSIVCDFNTALEQKHIVPYYQPIVELKTGEVVGLEALIRWQHPKQGLLYPNDFYDVFKDPQSCIKLGNEVLNQVAKDMKSWRKKNVDFGRVAINVEPANLTDDTFFTNLLQHIGKGAFRPDQLTIEITENSALRQNNTPIIERLRSMCAAGFNISLDDFGTGYSSISHIKSLPITAIKLDKSYVSNVMAQPHDHVIVKGLVSIASDLNIDTVAEGVESQDDWQALYDMGCEKGQGFYFSSAVPANLIASTIKDINTRSKNNDVIELWPTEIKNSA